MTVIPTTTRPTTALSAATRQGIIHITPTLTPTVLTTLLILLLFLLQHILHPPALVPTTPTATMTIYAVYPVIPPTHTTITTSSNYYYTYCPTTSTLDSICGSSCCYADVPVYANSDVFYYSTYHCPSTPYYNYNYYTTYCGSYCILAVVFGLFGSCFCLCGIAFSIAFCVLVHMMVNKKQKTTPVANTSYANSPGAAPESGLQDSTMAMKQQFKQETLPPQIPGYTYNPNPTNTDGVTPYPLQIDTNVNLPPNPVYNQLPQVVTHGTAQPFVPQSNIQQPPATNLPAEETYAYIQ